MGTCEFCGNTCDIKENSIDKNIMEYSCMSCGLYDLIEREYNLFKHEYTDKKHLISGYLYEFNKDSDTPFHVTNANLKMIFNDGRMPKTHMQRLERLLLNMYKLDNVFGNIFKTSNVANTSGYITTQELQLAYSKKNYPSSIAYA